jgi:hypothetical protein
MSSRKDIRGQLTLGIPLPQAEKAAAKILGAELTGWRKPHTWEAAKGSPQILVATATGWASAEPVALYHGRRSKAKDAYTGWASEVLLIRVAGVGEMEVESLEALRIPHDGRDQALAEGEIAANERRG